METAPVKCNPGVLGDEELVGSFVVRRKCLELILEALRENSGAVSSNRHLLVVGPRGIGKTMLVRRVAAEVRSNPDYGSVWYPIVFGEESYPVGSTGEFWLEALFHLSNSKGGRKLGRTLDELREEHDDARLRERALAQLVDFADKAGRRLLLVVENLNMLCKQITPEAAWELRHTLTNEPRIMLLGTATSRFDTITRAEKAWFELFAVHELRPLDERESYTLWRSVAKQDPEPGQVRAIRILTGGNPRLLTVLAGFAANRSFRELMEQLVHVIDDHTEYFKGHLDTLAVKERKVFVALLEQWNPASAADLARTTRLGVSAVSALLSRLVRRGAVELFEQRPRRKLYQAAERLYNIYYLMRRRGQPADRVRAVVSFMVMFYGGKQLAATIADLAREACGLPAGESGDHFEAFAELARRAPREVWNQALDQTPPEFFCREDTPESIRRLPKTIKLEEFRTQANAFYNTRSWSEAEQACRQALDLDENLVWARNNLGVALKALGRVEEAEQAFRRTTELEPKDERPWASLGNTLWELKRYEEARQAYRTAIELNPGESRFWDELGHLLLEIGPPEETERVWEEALRRHPKLAQCAVHLVEARFQRGVAADVVLREAEEWIERAGRTPFVLGSMSRFVLRSKLAEALPQAERWAREGAAKGPRGRFAGTLALVCATQGKWAEALQVVQGVLEAAADFEEARQRATDFLIQAAAAGHAREALELMVRSKSAEVLEPLVVGLRIYLGEMPQVAKEIVEIGQDVAERIREVARAQEPGSQTEIER